MVATDDESLLPASAGQDKVTPPGGSHKVLLLVSWLLLVGYMFSTPALAYLFNVKFGYAGLLCNTPAESIQCGNNASFLELAKEHGRYRLENGTKRYVGCKNGEGVLGESLCPVITKEMFGSIGSEGYSLSYFIATAPGTGVQAALSIFPMQYAWLYGHSNEAVLEYRYGPQAARYLPWLRTSMFLFQVFYGLFLCATYTIFRPFHMAFVGMFIVCLLVHWAAVALVSYSVSHQNRQEWIIIILAGVGVCAFVGGDIGLLAFQSQVASPPDYVKHDNLSGYGFWLGECIGLSCAFAMTPALVWFGQIKPPN